MTESTATWSKEHLQEAANRWEEPIRLAMHGVPLDLAMKATRNQLDMLWTIVQRDEQDKFKMQAHAIGLGVWDDGKKQRGEVIQIINGFFILPREDVVNGWNARRL